MLVWGVVVAAGLATRYGRPKHLEPLGGRRVLDWSLAAAREACDGLVLVVAPGSAPSTEPAPEVVVVEGASTRPGSVRRGLAAVPPDTEVVVVHDAARPLATARLFAAVVAAVGAGADGAVCAVPLGDTVKRVEEGRVVETVDRDGLWAVQTPQAFPVGALRRAHRGDPDATDDAALVERAGGHVVVVPGDVRNLKLTHSGDLAVAEALLATLAP